MDPGDDSEVLLGQILVKKGLLTREQLQAAFKEMQESVKAGQKVRLADILLRQGVVTPYNVSATYKLMRRAAVLECPACSLRKVQSDYEPNKEYSCPKCQKPLVAVRTPARPDKIPPHVEKAMQDPKNIFGRYVLVKQLGKGGMGVVHQAYDTALKRVVAVKILLTTDEDDVQRFMREAQTSAAISHPNICQIYEVGTIDGRHYITMQYIDGQNPLTMKLSLQQILEVTRQIALALEAAHERGVVHRDLKPSNILVDPKGKAYLLDFGLARRVEGDVSLTLSGLVAGTPSYMAPEQARGLKELVDRRSDVYGLGATMYHLLTGTAPFHGGSPLEVMKKVVEEEPTPPRKINEKIPREVEWICLKAMHKEQAQRYQTAAEFAQDIERFQKGLPTLARGTSVATVLRRGAQRHRGVLIGVVSTAVVAIVVAAALAWVSISNRAARIRELTEQADRLFDEKKWEEARRAYLRVLELDGSNAHATRRVSECERSSKEEAERIVKDEIRRRQQELEREKTQRREAEFDWQRGTQLYHDASRDFYRGGTLERMREALRKALDHLSRAIRTYPKFHEAYHARGLVYRLLGRTAEAEQDFSEAIRINPDYIMAHYDRGMLLLARYVDALAKMGRKTQHAGERVLRYREQALQDLQIVAKRHEGVVDEDLVNALLAFASEDFGRCVELCDRVLSADSQKEEALKLRGDAFWYLYLREETVEGEKYFNRALSDYVKALQIRVNYLEVYRNRGWMLYTAGRKKEAREDFERALKIQPDDPGAYEALGVVHLDQGEWEQALTYLDQAVKLGAESVVCFSAHGYVLMKMRKFDLALKDFERALEINPGHPGSLRGRGLVHKELGRKVEAISDFRKAALADAELAPEMERLIRELEGP